MSTRVRVELPPSLDDARWVDLKVAEEVTGMKKTWIYKEIQAGRFPAPMRLSSRCSRWTAASIRTYLIERAAEATGGQRA